MHYFHRAVLLLVILTVLLLGGRASTTRAADWEIDISIGNSGGGAQGMTAPGTWPSMTLVDFFLDSNGVWSQDDFGEYVPHTGDSVDLGQARTYKATAPYADLGTSGWFIFQFAGALSQGMNYFAIGWSFPVTGSNVVTCSYRQTEYGPDFTNDAAGNPYCTAQVEEADAGCGPIHGCPYIDTCSVPYGPCIDSGFLSAPQVPGGGAPRGSDVPPTPHPTETPTGVPTPRPTETPAPEPR